MSSRRKRHRGPDEDDDYDIIKAEPSSSTLKQNAAADDREFEEDDDDEDPEAVEEGASRFIPKAKLPKSQAVKRTTDALFGLIKRTWLDLEPEYQRDVVWAPTRKTKLIDSMFENFSIPPVIFNTVHVRENRWMRTCVDGKQRLTAIQDFMEGNIPCKDRNGLNWYYSQKVDAEGNPVAPKRSRILPDSVKEEFKNLEIVCIEYENLSEFQERDLFQRVQLGVPLSKAEALRGTKGDWQDFAMMYERDFPGVVKLIANRRASGFRTIIICFAMIYECDDFEDGGTGPALKQSADQLEKFTTARDTLDDETKSRLREVFEIFDDIQRKEPKTFQDNNYTHARLFAPIEMVAVAVLISKWYKRPRGSLIMDIKALRGRLREAHADLRMNGAVWKTAWEFIGNLEAYRGAVDGYTMAKKRRKTTRRRETSDTSSLSSITQSEQADETATPTQAQMSDDVQDMSRANSLANDVANAASRHTSRSSSIARLQEDSQIATPEQHRTSVDIVDSDSHRESQTEVADVTIPSIGGVGGDALTLLPAAEPGESKHTVQAQAHTSSKIQGSSIQYTEAENQDLNGPYLLARPRSSTPDPTLGRPPSSDLVFESKRAPVASMENASIPPSRPHLDLGSSSQGARLLAEKKARILGGVRN